MKFPDPLRTENPNDFRTKRLVVSRDSGYFNVRYIGPDISFQEMDRGRDSVNPWTMYHNLQERHHAFVNLGVGGVLTLDFEGDSYLLGSNQDQADIDATVLNLVSGFAGSKHLATPILALDEEVAEEVLPITKQEKLIRFRRAQRPIERPFAEHFQDYPAAIALEPGARYSLKNLEARARINKRDIGGAPGIYFETRRNAVKLVFDYHLDLGDIDFRELGVSLHLTNEYLDSDVLKTRVRPYSALLVQLNQGQLTDRVYSLRNGNRDPIDPKTIVLSEAFTLDEHSIAHDNKIPLIEFLEKQ